VTLRESKEVALEMMTTQGDAPEEQKRERLINQSMTNILRQKGCFFENRRKNNGRKKEQKKK
jgi:hypothetical protein